MPDKKLRIIIAKIGCDIHERGALTLLRALQDGGMEVIYTGKYQTPEGVVKMAIEEDADAIALSDSTGSMRHIASSVVRALEKNGAPDIRLIAGGLIPKKDLPFLKKIGVTGNFGPGTPLPTIVDHIRAVSSKR
ncbi:MAG: hypothetical protein A3K30_03680 [Deltaproteobacteria bacterium RBG_13_51_10]|nr:MAG: hypothetical protein A3K30_03680 [Deltaproteobacteria bacterium RBG_13_51_10]